MTYIYIMLSCEVMYILEIRIGYYSTSIINKQTCPLQTNSLISIDELMGITMSCSLFTTK